MNVPCISKLGAIGAASRPTRTSTNLSTNVPKVLTPRRDRSWLSSSSVMGCPALRVACKTGQRAARLSTRERSLLPQELNCHSIHKAHASTNHLAHGVIILTAQQVAVNVPAHLPMQ